MNELAKMIADALMTNSEGEVADRLVLEKAIYLEKTIYGPKKALPKIVNLGGRNRSSVEQAILRVLLAEVVPLTLGEQ